MTRLERAQFGNYLLIDTETGANRLVQSDWDFPGIASNWGFVPCKACSETDGTIDCAHRTAAEMISDAANFLDEVADDGREAEDPGYFD